MPALNSLASHSLTVCIFFSYQDKQERPTILRKTTTKFTATFLFLRKGISTRIHLPCTQVQEAKRRGQRVTNVLLKIFIYLLLIFPFCTNNSIPIQTCTGASKPISHTVFSAYTSFLPIKITVTKFRANPAQKLKNKKICTRKSQRIQTKLKQYISSVFKPAVCVELLCNNSKNKGNSTSVLHYATLAYCHTKINYVASHHIPSFSCCLASNLSQVLVVSLHLTYK